MIVHFIRTLYIMRDLVLIVHDIRSCHNVGSLLRTAEGLGVSKVHLTGYTPYPAKHDDTRLPHISQKLTEQIHKTALGAEISQPWQRTEDVTTVISELKSDGYTVLALEQTENSVPLHTYSPSDKLALLLGREVDGIDANILKLADIALEITMYGSKESFNVVQAAAMALFHLRFHA